MNTRIEVKNLLRESGNESLWSVSIYDSLLSVANSIGKTDSLLRQFWKTLEGSKEQYIHNLFVKNKAKILLEIYENRNRAN